MKHAVALASIMSLLSCACCCQDIITGTKTNAAFPVVSASATTAIYVEETDHWLVQKAAALLQEDIRKVTGRQPEIVHVLPASALNLIIIGSLDSSALIARLAGERRINGTDLKGKWEAYSLQVIDAPAKGIGKAMIIAGSDRRGTAFGIFELSRQIGVSPWYWWADVPVKKKNELWIRSGAWKYGPPAVKYRGFFINDEAPAFSGWTKEKFGGVNHQVYEKIFELLLRMKANFLWPAMWGNAFNDDDTLNPILADKYGIVMGTSHHEPMLRAQQEWKRYGSGAWNYETNKPTLDSFWRKGIQHMGPHESIVTIGMRGDGDKPMTQGSNIALLEQIVSDQRKIIGSVTGKDPAATPQAWALYKEVQDYYDKGMRVPDDVTLLLCDDNWGNARKLPRLGEKTRAGGYGMYYHFDYVGGPRNYKWLNTNPIARVWEQMHLTLQYGVDRIWIVNIGDIKPLEFPTEFFLDYAWSPGRWPAESLKDYTRKWAAEQFGQDHAAAIAEILTKYATFNGRRKPELLSPDTYSLLNYGEAENITAEYNRLSEQADSVGKLLPADYQDAYYQLVLYPVKACANLNELYVTAGKNRLYAAQGRAATDSLANRVRTLFGQDSIFAHYYNKEMADGKWDHMMDQTHIGYTYWQQPPVNKMPEVMTSELPAAAEMGVAIEGSASWWPHDTANAVLPIFDRNGERSHYLEIFN
ncbi:MAG TPA: glycosyl hydrolase 115 family protein, partial [Puia sp.]|nr:glycosyl hydrolase 115 family protein [Puia sp.]